jgi:uncharacterized protein YjhX (UPF0386 family)
MKREIHFLNYADGDQTYIKDQAKNSTHVKSLVNKQYEYRRSDIDTSFYEKNKKVLDEKKGAGYRLWKPYFVHKVLDENMNRHEILVYMHSNLYFIKNVDIENTLNILDVNNKGIIVFESPMKNIECVKQKCLSMMKMDTDEYKYKNFCGSDFILLRKNSLTLELVQEWLMYSRNYDFVCDAESTDKNYKEFKEHKGESSIFSLLVEKFKIDRISSDIKNGIVRKYDRQYFYDRQNLNGNKQET